MPKATAAWHAKTLTDIPNIGPAMARDLSLLGITRPAHLVGKDPLHLYHKLNEVTGVRQDPCVADTFMAAVDFMQGGAPKPWWAFTEKRKALLADPRFPRP